MMYYHPIPDYQVPVKEYNWDELEGKIFKCQFRITTKRKWTYSEFDFEHVGIFVTGDLDDDLNSMNDWVNTTRTISDLVEMFDEGKEFIIPNPKDIEIIFMFIQDYTEYVGHVFNTRIHITHHGTKMDPEVREVLADLIKMQNFANRIFPVAVKLNKDDTRPVLTGILGWLNQSGHNLGLPPLTFDPVEKYGIDPKAFEKEENFNKETGMFNAINLADVFDPHAFKTINGNL